VHRDVSSVVLPEEIVCVDGRAEVRSHNIAVLPRRSRILAATAVAAFESYPVTVSTTYCGWHNRDAPRHVSKAEVWLEVWYGEREGLLWWLCFLLLCCRGRSDSNCNQFGYR
jgi:hypothetical protein